METCKVTICFPNRTDAGTLSGGNWQSAFPLNNLKDPVFKRRARSVGVSTTDTTFSMTLAANRAVSVVAIASHNLTTQASWRVRVYEDAGQTTLLHDSGTQFAWPSVYSQSQLEWEYDNFWTGTPSEDETSLFTPLSIYFLPETVIARSVRVDIDDAGNAAGWVQIGRLFVSEAWQPTYNMSYGNEQGYRDETPIDRALDGTKYWDPKTPERLFRFSLDFLTQEEAFNRVLLMQRTLGTSGELLVAPELTLDPQYFLRTFIGTLADLNPVARPFLDYHKNQFLVTEKL
jgi:hypothetical protein